MYQIKEEKLHQSALTNEIKEIKEELFQSIDEENKRINVDSAKKRAVMQHMDYDNFRQMVLGANIKPMKSKEIAGVMGQQYPIAILNANASTTFADQKDEIDPSILLKLNIQKEFKQPENFREFKKSFENCLKNDSTGDEAIDFLKSIPLENYSKVFGVEIDAEYYLKIIQILKNQLQNKIDNSGFYCEFMIAMSKISGFNMNILKLFAKSEKKILKEWIENLIQLSEKDEMIKSNKEILLEKYKSVM